MLKDILISLRPRQWVKNVVIFAPLIFSKNFLEGPKTLRVFAAAFLFCLVSASIYLINDMLDREEDRKHPDKKHRPIARGTLSLKSAGVAAYCLAAVSLLGAYVLNRNFAAIALAYLAIEVLYSLHLKDVVVLDIFCIASGFFLRVLSGAVVIQVPVSNWLFICTIFLSLFLALAKRRGEMVLLGAGAHSHRKVLCDYSLAFIDQMITVVTASTILSYALYTFAPETIAKFHTKNLGYTIPFVVYGVFRYLYLVYQKNGGQAPEKHLFTDRPLLIDVILYLVTIGVIIYR